MACWEKIPTGAIIGVGVVAAAIFTGEDLILPGVSLAVSLKGTGIAAGSDYFQLHIPLFHFFAEIFFVISWLKNLFFK